MLKMRSKESVRETMSDSKEVLVENQSTGAKKFASWLIGTVNGPIVGLVVMCVVLTITSPFFLTTRNINNILVQSSDIGILAAGETLVILIGGIDLSVAAIMVVTMMFTGWLYKMESFPFVIALIAGLVLGALIGLVNGLLCAYGKVQAFVATLATMSACLGMALVITNGNTLNTFPTWFGNLTASATSLIPVQSILLVVVFLALAFWLKFRPAGRALYAIGGNEEVARLSGLPVKKLKTFVYVVSGFLAALAGWINISLLDSAQPTAGSSYLLTVIAVVVIGGASLAGGIGSMGQTFVGLLIIGVLNAGLALLHVNPNLQQVVIGAVILAAVLTDRNQFNFPIKFSKKGRS
jgi:ribose transport system permease protein